MSAYQGLKVLDCSQGRAGPMAAMLFADFGAEVLKVEPPEGDWARATPGYQMWNRNKRTTKLDIAGDGREALEPLLAAADIAVFDFSPQRMQALGLMDAAERHPRLVNLWTPPYGTTGAWSELKAHHGVLQALSGAAYRQSAYADQPVYLVMPLLHYLQATLAAASASAALFQRALSGLGQAVTVSGLNAVAMVGGSSGVVAPATRQPLGGSPSYRLYECKDGQFLFLATLFRYFFDRAVAAMGVEGIELIDGAFAESVPAVMQAKFREKTRDEWLEILHAADVPAAPVGLREAWLASEIIANNDMRVVLEHVERGPVEMPGAPVKLSRTPAAVRRLPRAADEVEIAAFGQRQPPASGEGTGSTQGPLAGVRVLDLGTVIAGAYASGILSNLGAEVVKVEGTDGDPWRAYELGFAAYNRGKRGLVVDLKQDTGREVFLDLAAKADVVLDNYRLGTRDRLGIGHAAVAAVNPRAISCSVTTYGAKGEETRRPGFDPLLQALSGMMAAQGGDGEPPVFHTIAVNDFASAAMAAFGVITALNARERTGEGQVMETSLAAQSAIFQSGELTTWAGAPPAPKGCRDCLGLSALDRFYACADGWILVACDVANEARALATALGAPEWATAFDMLAEPRDGALAKAIQQALAKQPLDAVVKLLLAAGVRAAPVVARGTAAGDPWLAENGFMDAVIETPDGPVRDTRYVAFSRSAIGYRRPEPGLGEHSFEVLADWGIDPERIARLGEDGIIMRLC
ncbi:MAG TPA: CoA transferase [Caulobacteraceae bacterium]|nr:CoA transferase [Caulobacteraceae bacterium]